MKPKDLKTVVDFYQNVIVAQIIKPIECEQVYRLVKPDGMAVPYYQKMRAITLYVQGLQQEVLDGLEELFLDFDEDQQDLAKDTRNPMSRDYIPEDSAASPALAQNSETDTQSHSEDMLFTDIIDGGIHKDNPILDKKFDETKPAIDFPAVEAALDAVDGLIVIEEDGTKKEFVATGIDEETGERLGKPAVLNTEEEAIKVAIESLETAYKEADSNTKRSITMKIKALKKKL